MCYVAIVGIGAEEGHFATPCAHAHALAPPTLQSVARGILERHRLSHHWHLRDPLHLELR